MSRVKGGAVRGDCQTRSMTGYGSGSASNGEVELIVEIRTVNNRFLDPIFKLPRGYAEFESELKSNIGERIKRGRVEVYVTRRALATDKFDVQLSRGVFDAMLSRATGLCSELGVLNEEMTRSITLELLKNQDILSYSEGSRDLADEKIVLFEALEKALTGVMKMRAAEGAALAIELTTRMVTLREIHKTIQQAAIKGPDYFKETLLKRLKLLPSEIFSDQTRLYQEAVFMADRVDVSEELSRLLIHFDQFDLAMREAVQGRKIDFIIQELGREFNTVGSKAQDAAIQSSVVAAKVELEKLREQVQNVE